MANLATLEAGKYHEPFDDADLGRNELRAMVTALWDILDDIDTASDECKDNEQCYRETVERLHKKRFDVLVSDGYDLFMP